MSEYEIYSFFKLTNGTSESKMLAESMWSGFPIGDKFKIIEHLANGAQKIIQKNSDKSSIFCVKRIQYSFMMEDLFEAVYHLPDKKSMIGLDFHTTYKKVWENLFDFFMSCLREVMIKQF